jgi:hypothetical protein
MNKKLGSSRMGKRLAVALGVAVAASTIAVPSSGAAKISASAKNDLLIMINEPDAGWCNQDSPGIDQVAAKNSVLETLTIMNDKGKIVPYLAEAFSSSADFKQWTVKLRQGVKFHDGEELTSKTIQVNMLANAGLIQAFMGKGQAASLPAIGWLDLAGINAALNRRTPTVPVDGPGAIAAKWASFFKIIDTYTVQFNLATPRPNFPFYLWNVGRGTVMSSASLVSPSCGTTVAAGTGPFMVKSKGTDPNTTVLTANPNYWRKAKDGSKLPKASTVTFKTVGDAAQRVNALQRGQADLATFGATSGTQVNLLKTLKGKVTLHEGVRDTSWVFHLNTTQLPFAKKSARLAFAHAIDTKAFATLMTVDAPLLREERIAEVRPREGQAVRRSVQDGDRTRPEGRPPGQHDNRVDKGQPGSVQHARRCRYPLLAHGTSDLHAVDPSWIRTPAAGFLVQRELGPVCRVRSALRDQHEPRIVGLRIHRSDLDEVLRGRTLNRQEGRSRSVCKACCRRGLPGSDLL